MRLPRRAKQREKRPATAQTPKTESRLSGTPELHLDPVDDQPSREDVEKAKESARWGIGPG